ncbi:MAG: ABC transporter substrate-binding protein [Thermoanaerobaculia bacterium]
METTSHAAGSTAPFTPPRPIRVGLPGTLSVLDPRKAVDYVSGLVLDQIFDAPYTAAAGDASAAPLLFEPLRGEGARTGMHYSAAVRPGVFFSDGTPLTAEIAARSLRDATVLAGKVTVDVRGDRVWFTLSSSNSRFDLTLAQSSCAIVLEKGAHFFGTGPYMFEEPPNLRLVQRTPRLRLIRNPHYHGTAHAGEIEFHILRPEADGTPRSLVEAFLAGAVDVTTALSAADLATWKIPGAVPVIKPSNSTAFLFMNTTRRPLDTAAARRAIAATIDLLEIASKCYDRNPAAFVATTALPPAMSRGGGVARANTADGARLIEESGLRGARLTLIVPWTPRPYLSKPGAIAEIIRKRLADAGVSISLVETKTSDEYFQYLAAGRFDLALGGWIADTADPADYFDALLSSHVISNGTFANYARWADPATDAHLARFRVDPSDANRREIERVIAEEVPFLPLVHGQSSAVHSRRVRNVTVTATGSMSLANVVVT